MILIRIKGIFKMIKIRIKGIFKMIKIRINLDKLCVLKNIIGCV